MASHVLYPPTIDSYLPSFQVNAEGGSCPIKFSLSKFNGISEIKGIHIAVTKQKSGLNVVKTVDDTSSSIKRFRSTGIIILEGGDFIEQITGEDNLFQSILLSEDLYPEEDDYKGFIPGWIYKVQIRLSEEAFNEREVQTDTLAKWLNDNASSFSEWSTICVIKPIGDIEVDFGPGLEFTYEQIAGGGVLPPLPAPYHSSTLDLIGNFISLQDSSETLYSYRFKLSENNVELEDSGIIICKNYQDINQFRYLFKTELVPSTYRLTCSFVTNNGFSFSFSTSFNVQYNIITLDNLYVATVENYRPGVNVMAGLSSTAVEEDEGRIGLKLVSTSSSAISGTFIIRRASSKDNFSTWEDIKYFTLTSVVISDLGLIYDYTVESGVWYLYGIQKINNGIRTALAFPQDEEGHDIKRPSLRNFEYSFLLGENNQQLKLKFNNTMGNYKVQLMESKSETIGGVYPFVSRNSNLRYRIIPINGLISFEMDENNLFCEKQVIYKYSDIVSLYDNYKNVAGDMQYNFIYERDFRKMVIDFLINGKPKLFKSPTEGNIIVRLMDINFTPNQILDRMIYSFTSNGNEIAEDNIDNYIKYGFLVLDQIDDSSSIIDVGHIHSDADVNDSPKR